MLRLVRIDNGRFDLAFADTTITDNMDDVETIVYAALFTDQEAPDERIDDRYDRHGWWADPAAGSGLWHIRRQALTDAARAEALDMVRQTLEKRTAGLSDIVVSMEDSVNPDSLYLTITGTYRSRKFTLKVTL
ncbi:phage GP46 family protein [Oxalobacter aliiformigenes]|uniref:phage GP46 family protein n=1 Tax=Oxalobacter aliiformigenes TaxID=2946593 RepID=UPI0022AED83D|nr:phage GP46 family protein [Oxalobacter aliiformigenes]MCZ4065650.1 phage GP46 family protein [Oxalobacter aliiformigenes]WAV98336.1 phage GP46 family protein [Oxalobacter aliiformigenes]